MRSRALIVWAGVLALALAGSAIAQATFEEIIMARDEAMNAEDVDTAVSLYADDATYTVIFGPDEEPLVLTGKDAIYERLAGFMGGHVHYDATVMAVIGATACALSTWAIDGLRGDGVDHIEQFEEFVFKDGKIVEHTMTVLRMVPAEEP
ncbi:MAG: nuclear transport factor 2 family protein [Trueperaceae bacterium]